jgi:hypothetical protein
MTLTGLNDPDFYARHKAIRRRRLRKQGADARRRAHVRRMEMRGKLRLQWWHMNWNAKIAHTKEQFLFKELEKLEKQLLGKVAFAYAGFKKDGAGAVFVVVDAKVVPHVELDLKFRNRRELKQEIADAANQLRKLLGIPQWERAQ